MGEPFKPWANRVLEIFGADNERHAVSCVGCRSPFGNVQGLLSHRRSCSGTPGIGPNEQRLAKEAARAGRHRDTRATTIEVQRLSKREQEAERRRDAEAERFIPVAHLTRPRTRGECDAVARPCPFVSCRYHLYLDVNKNGSIKLNFPDLEPDELIETCALDVADFGGERLEVVAELVNVVRERVRQIEKRACERLHQKARVNGLRGSDFEHPEDRVQRGDD